MHYAFPFRVRKIRAEANALAGHNYCEEDEMNISKVTKLIAGATSALLLVGCADTGFFSLGGTIPTQNPEKTGPRYRANFGGFFDACDLDNVHGHVTYHDRYSTLGEIRIEGLVEEAAECVDFGNQVDGDCTRCRQWFEEATGEELLDFAQGGYLGYAKIRYRSQDMKSFDPSQNGTAYVCAADFGEGAKATDDDYLLMKVTSGPYAGYTNFGPVQGNINHRDCED